MCVPYIYASCEREKNCVSLIYLNVHTVEMHKAGQSIEYKDVVFNPEYIKTGWSLT